MAIFAAMRSPRQFIEFLGQVVELQLSIGVGNLANEDIVAIVNRFDLYI